MPIGGCYIADTTFSPHNSLIHIPLTPANNKIISPLRVALLIGTRLGATLVAEPVFHIAFMYGIPIILAITLVYRFYNCLLTLLLTIGCSGLTLISFFLTVNPDAIGHDFRDRKIAMISI